MRRKLWPSIMVFCGLLLLVPSSFASWNPRSYNFYCVCPPADADKSCSCDQAHIECGLSPSNRVSKCVKTGFGVKHVPQHRYAMLFYARCFNSANMPIVARSMGSSPPRRGLRRECRRDKNYAVCGYGTASEHRIPNIEINSITCANS